MSATLFDPPPAAPVVHRTVVPTAKRVATPLGFALDHPCGACGAAVAPFGFGVSIRAAMATGDRRRAGLWLCRACLEEGEP